MARAKWDDSMLLCDTREQDSLFPNAEKITMKTGDYTARGLEGLAAVERKSIQDLLGSLGGKRGIRRKRFEAEFERLGQMQRPCVVIEGTIAKIYSAPKWGRISSSHAVGAMISWSARYRVPVFFCDDRVVARSVTKTYLRLAWEEFQKGGCSTQSGTA